jgi:hypothetical protein
MNILKKGLFITLSTLGFAQLQAQNPGVNNVQVQPAPLTAVGDACVLSFQIGNFAANPLTGTTLSRRMGFIATITKTDAVPNTVAAMTGTILTAFDVTYDPAIRTFTGKQKANFNIPPLAVYTANIAAQVTQATPITNVSIGVSINIQPAPFYSAFNSQGDDYAAAFTYTGAPLAIGPVDFELISKNCAAVLQWKLTKTEDVASFDVYESTDGNAYHVVKTITVEQGKQTYTYSRSHLDGGLKYYYILVKDKNGEQLKTSTKIISLDCNNFGVTVSPNPTTDKVNVKFNSAKEQKYQVKIFDDAGKLVHIIESQAEVGNNTCVVDLSAYAVGNYLINCTIGNKNTETFKVVKQ